ncbi:MAG: hypothetical protein J2P36_31605, partial [Ktedonobacteraceae bacterium]|nr:hypothetical protein [Ktedonobacteraceae bacterium]
AEMREVIALTSLCLPTGVRSHRSDDLKVQMALTLHQHIGVHVAGVQEVFAGKERSFGQRLLNGSDRLTIEDPSSSRFNMGDEMDLLVLTCFGEMNLVTGPSERAFIAKTCFWVIGRIKAETSRRKIVGFAPASPTFLCIVLKHPGLP